MPPAYLGVIVLMLVASTVTSGRGIFSREFQLIIVFVTVISLLSRCWPSPLSP